MKLRLALIGFGGVNQGVVDLLHKKNATLNRYGMKLAITVVTDLRFGVLINPDGIDLQALARFARENFHIEALLRDGKCRHVPAATLEQNLKAIASSDVDVVIEATFTDPATGEPALSHCKTALECGKHVVTTNKGPVAHALRELQRIGQVSGAQLKYEGAVMSGTPVLRQITTTLRGATVKGFAGILNGTSNFVIGQVERGMSFDDAVREAQRLGYAEANPAADIEGSDVQLKVVILANALWDAGLTREDVACQGITGLSAEQIRSARAEGASWRLIGTAMIDEAGRIHACVEPRRLEAGHALLAASGVTNAVAFDTDVLGAVTISGPGAGREETAFAILSDLIELHDALVQQSEKAAA